MLPGSSLWKLLFTSHSQTRSLCRHSSLALSASEYAIGRTWPLNLQEFKSTFPNLTNERVVSIEHTSISYRRPSPTCSSALEKIIVNGYKALNLVYFFTSGKDEVKAWTIQ
ncbi:Obg-like ATPase 1, partial [Elysia marginata]